MFNGMESFIGNGNFLFFPKTNLQSIYCLHGFKAHLQLTLPHPVPHVALMTTQPKQKLFRKAWLESNAVNHFQIEGKHKKTKWSVLKTDKNF